jgi:hypothetical protein
MRVMKAVVFLCALSIMTLTVQSAFALPYSTYGSENGWAGHKNYTQDGFDLTVVFNVYDISLGQFNWQGEEAIPEGDNYIYAYQIFNNSDSAKDVAYFSVLDILGNVIPSHLMHSTGSQSDGSGQGIEPDPDATEPDAQGEWAWSPASGYIQPGRRSWYLIFSSDHGPVKGKFEVRASEETEPPVPEVPEPATIAFFGSAAVWLATRRNIKRRTA